MNLHTHLLPLFFGILEIIVLLIPLKTSYKIFKGKSTEGHDSTPYSVTLFSCMLLLYYGSLKTENGIMIITINSIGCALQTTYIAVFLIYTTRKSLIATIKLLLFFNVLSFGLIIMATLLITDHGPKRVVFVGWICAISSICIYIHIMILVIKMKRVEYTSIYSSEFLMICNVMQFIYNLLIRDYYVATTNLIGFVFEVAQMILYFIYNDKGEPAPSTTDLEKNLKIQENDVVGVGEVELGFDGSKVAGDKKEDVKVNIRG